MAKTRHIQKRMSQRGIKQAMIDMVLNFGVPQGDKIILNRKGLDGVLRELETLKQSAMKMRERGGVVVVANGDTLLTTYGLDS